MAATVKITPFPTIGGPTAKQAVYTASGITTYGAAAGVSEMAIIIGANAAITNRMKLQTTIAALHKMLEAYLKKKRIGTSLPGATDRVLIALSMTPTGLYKSPGNYARTIVAAATTIVETDIGIVFGSTLYGTGAGVGPIERGNQIYNAFKHLENAYKQGFAKKN